VALPEPAASPSSAHPQQESTDAMTDREAPAASRPLGKAAQTPSPGARRSPQRPGATPDRSTVPGHHSEKVAPAEELRRPLTQYASAQEVMNVYTPDADGVWTKERFEQAPVAAEEARKAHPANLTPNRPVPGFALGSSTQTDAAAALEAGKAGE
jgi:hypothetical protein